VRVGIVSAAVPLREGDAAAAIGEALEAALRAAGHEAELVLLPFDDATAGAQLVQRAAYRAMEFAPHYDLVVTLRTPAEVVRHGRKVAWLLDDPLIPPVQEGTLPHRALAAACARASLVGLREARGVLAASEAVAERLRAAGLDVDVVPPGDWERAAQAVLA
jgi:hypothetical protein